MKTDDQNTILRSKNVSEKKLDSTGIDINADKTGTDNNADATQSKTAGSVRGNKFDKAKRETNPDRTGIDINADKTKKGK